MNSCFFCRVWNYLRDAKKGGAYMAELFAHVANGSLKTHIQAELPFTPEGVRKAQEAMVGGTSAGKMVLKVT